MANPSNSIDVRIPLAEFRAQYADLFVTLKIDQAGREVALANVREKPGQLYGNAADDWWLRLIAQFPRRFYDNRQAVTSDLRIPAAAAAISVTALGPAGDFDFEIVSGLRSGTLVWARLVSSGGTPSADANLELFHAATRLPAERLYGAENVDPTAGYVEGTPAALIQDDGADLTGTLYGRITNNGAAASDFALELVLEGIAG